MQPSGGQGFAPWQVQPSGGPGFAPLQVQPSGGQVSWWFSFVWSRGRNVCVETSFRRGKLRGSKPQNRRKQHGPGEREYKTWPRPLEYISPAKEGYVNGLVRGSGGREMVRVHPTRLMPVLWQNGRIVWRGGVGAIFGINFDAISMHVEDAARLSAQGGKGPLTQKLVVEALADWWTGEERRHG